MLAWLEHPIAVNERWRTRTTLERAPTSAEAATRFRVVLELLTGVPPAKLAAREGISEEELYRWRSLAMSAARDALSG